jgi:hypothetical protein
VPSRVRGVAVCTLLPALLVALVGCGGGTDAPTVTGATRAACTKLVKALPSSVAGKKRGSAGDADLQATWGDPAIELTCGVGRPAGYTKISFCQTTNGVDWFVPEEQIEDQSADVTMTTRGRSPRVQVRLPARYRPPADVMVDLAAAVKAHTTKSPTGGCA